ncbi:ATP-grasp domain-containing protein [Herbidospora sp. RD11066]
MKAAYVTWDGPDPERETVLSAWLAEGIEGAPVRWDDPEADWSSFDAAVVRSPWDYVGRRDEFIGWAWRAEQHTRLLNPASVLEWNTDKTYMKHLGVPTVPTHWSSLALPDWAEYVVKPTISAGARDTMRTASKDEAAAFAASLEAQGRPVMVQPYVESVEHEGELSLHYFNGQFSHAVRRTPLLLPGIADLNDAGIKATLRDPDDDQFDLAEEILGKVAEPLLYARVDLVRMPGGEPVMIELELTEPYLYLDTELDAPAMFARALKEMLA